MEYLNVLRLALSTVSDPRVLKQYYIVAPEMVPMSSGMTRVTVPIPLQIGNKSWQYTHVTVIVVASVAPFPNILRMDLPVAQSGYLIIEAF